MAGKDVNCKVKQPRWGRVLRRNAHDHHRFHGYTEPHMITIVSMVTHKRTCCFPATSTMYILRSSEIFLFMKLSADWGLRTADCAAYMYMTDCTLSSSSTCTPRPQARAAQVHACSYKRSTQRQTQIFYIVWFQPLNRHIETRTFGSCTFMA